MKTVAAVSVGRSDYGILRPVFRAIAASPALRLQIIVAGTHLSALHDRTVAVIEADGFEIAAEVETLPVSDTPVAIADAVGQGISGFAAAYAALRPDLVLLAGDRFETLSAAFAAVPLTLPIAHLHGGEISAGAIDDQIRHAITKLSHLHFVATPRSAARVLQMGEEPWRVVTTGAPALDEIESFTPWPQRQVEERIGMPLTEAPLLVTYHPATMEFGSAAADVAELTTTIDRFRLPVVVTAPNVDTSSAAVRQHLRDWSASRPHTVFVENLGTQGYWSLMSLARAVVGNSSSGIIEAASFKCPVVDVGNRQAGRERPANVIHTTNSRDDIERGLRHALSSEFRAIVAELTNPYGDGHASERIVSAICASPPADVLRLKQFHERSIDPS